jgi:hypothetical protein
MGVSYFLFRVTTLLPSELKAMGIESRFQGLESRL